MCFKIICISVEIRKVQLEATGNIFNRVHFFIIKIGQLSVTGLSKANHRIHQQSSALYEFLWVAYQSFHLVIPNTALCTCWSNLIIISWYQWEGIGLTIITDRC